MCCTLPFLFFFFFNDTATTEIYTLSLHDALPIWLHLVRPAGGHAVAEGQPVPQPERPAHAADSGGQRLARGRADPVQLELQLPRQSVLGGAGQDDRILA